MKLEYTEGCVCDSLSIDGIETIDMDINDFKKVIHKLIDNEKDFGTLQSIFMDCVSMQGDYKCSDKPCPQCGDYIVTYTLEIQ